MPGAYRMTSASVGESVVIVVIAAAVNVCLCEIERKSFDLQDWPVEHAIYTFSYAIFFTTALSHGFIYTPHLR